MNQLQTVASTKNSVNTHQPELHEVVDFWVLHLAKLVDRNLNPAKNSQDLDEIKEIAQNLSDSLSEHLSEFGLLKDAKQGPHHKEGTVLQHTVLVAFNVIRIASKVLGRESIISYGNKVTNLGRVLVMSALFHDISKPWPEVREREDRFLYHAEASALWVERKQDLLKLNEHDLKLLIFLVKWHMHPHVVNPELRERFEFIARFENEIPETFQPSSQEEIIYLLILSEADACSTYVGVNEETGEFEPAPFNQTEIWKLFGVTVSSTPEQNNTES